MIKKMLTQLTLLLLPLTLSAGIVNNAGIQATDSLTFEFYLLDSAGQNMPQLLSTDSVFLHVYYPSGALAYRDSVAGNNSAIAETANSSFHTYSFRRLVGNIDGAGSDGIYKWLVVAKDRSLDLLTPVHGEFQLYQGGDYHALLNFIMDSLQSILDTLQVGVAVASVQAAATAEIADGVWDELQAGHNIGGSFGSYLDADISGLGSGSGLYSYSIVLYDTLAAQVVPGVNVALRNLDQTSLIAVGNSDLAGEIAFNLDAGSYTLVASSPSYLFNPFDTLVVTASGQDTIKGINFDPGTATSPSLCRVYGFLYDISGLPQQGSEIKAALPSGVYRQGSLVVSPFEVTTVSDSLGYFYLDLIPSDSLLPVASQYKLTIVSPKGTVMRRSFLIPASSSWQLSW